MNRYDKIKKDPRIMRPLAQLLQEIQETLGPPDMPPDHSTSTNTQETPTSDPKDNQ